MTTTGLQLVDVRDVADVHVRIFAGPSEPDRYMIGGYYYPWAQLVGELEFITGRELRKFYFPKVVLQSLGSLYSFVNRYVEMSFQAPIDRESVSYATQWVYADSNKLEQEFDFEFRDERQSLVETLQWIVESGNLDKKYIGKLAAD